MSNRKTPYQHFSVNNLPSGSIHKEGVLGNFLLLLSYTGTDSIYVSFGGETFQVLPKGIAVELPEDEKFLDLRFKQLSGAAQSFDFVITSGKVFDSRLVLQGSLDVNISANSNESPEEASITDTASIAVAADSTCREVILQNNGSNDCWIGDSNVDGSSRRGYKLESGSSVIITSGGAIYARCLSGLTTTLSIFKTKKV